MQPSKPQLKPCDSFASLTIDRYSHQSSIYTDLADLNDRARQIYCETLSQTNKLDEWLCDEHHPESSRCSHFYEPPKTAQASPIRPAGQQVYDSSSLPAHESVNNKIHNSWTSHSSDKQSSCLHQQNVSRSTYRQKLEMMRSRLKEIDEENIMQEETSGLTDSKEASKLTNRQQLSASGPKKQERATVAVGEFGVQTRNRKKIFTGDGLRMSRPSALAKENRLITATQSTQFKAEMEENKIQDIQTANIYPKTNKLRQPIPSVKQQISVLSTTLTSSWKEMEYKKYKLMRIQENIAETTKILFSSRLGEYGIEGLIFRLRQQLLEYSKQYEVFRTVLQAKDRIHHEKNHLLVDKILGLAGWIFQQYKIVAEKETQLNQFVRDFLIIDSLEQKVKLRHIHSRCAEFRSTLNSLEAETDKLKSRDSTLCGMALGSRLLKEFRQFLQISVVQVQDFLGTIEIQMIENEVRGKNTQEISRIYEKVQKNELVASTGMFEFYKIELLQQLQSRRQA